MIFVTVGGQIPFDRLVRAVDSWAEKNNRSDVFAQIGSSSFEPRVVRWTRFLSPAEFRRTVEQAQVVVSHAGMGTILTALDCGTPVIVLPRRAHLGETRNDHQVATMRHLGERWQIHPAADEVELLRRLDQLDELQAPRTEGPGDQDRLLQSVRRFIEEA